MLFVIMSIASTGCLTFGWLIVLNITGNIGLFLFPMPGKLEKARMPLMSLYNSSLFLWWVWSMIRCD